VHHRLAAALLQGLVRLVGAVGIVVAHPAEGDAGRGAALELVRAARGGRAVQLVAAVAAVVLAVADEIPGDAAAAGAGELVGAACDVAAVFFIFATVTIIFTIAPPGHWDTLSGTGATADFIYAACSHMALFRVFIRAVFTVGIPVTLPPAGDTLAIVAHKVRLGTRLLYTVPFVTAVSAVFVPVTFPQQRNTAAICALELGGFTFGFSSRSGGAAFPGRPAQREQQPERPARGRAHGARLDGAAAAAAARSAQQVTSPYGPGRRRLHMQRPQGAAAVSADANGSRRCHRPPANGAGGPGGPAAAKGNKHLSLSVSATLCCAPERLVL